MSSDALRIAIVDDHPTLLMGLAAVLVADNGCQVVATGGTAQDAIAIGRDLRPDVMLLDLSMPGDAFEAMRAIVESSPETGIVVFTAYAEVDLAKRALAAGARGFVLKGRPVDDLHAAIAAARDGELYISPEFAEKLAHSDPDSSKARRGVSLSPREEQLLACLFEAMSNKEIARKLDLSEKTVKHYMTNLMAKLNARNRLEVVIAARELRGALGTPTAIPEATAPAD